MKNAQLLLHVQRQRVIIDGHPQVPVQGIEAVALQVQTQVLQRVVRNGEESNQEPVWR